jgi:hypothetical protein
MKGIVKGNKSYETAFAEVKATYLNEGIATE